MPPPRRLLLFIGTGPDAIKLAPLVLAARAHGSFDVHVCACAGRQRAMLASVLALFDIRPDFELTPTRPGQSPTGVTIDALGGLAPVLAAVRPVWVVVQGGAASAFAAALGAFHAGVRVAHVEAGLRSTDSLQPCPDEINRKLVGAIACLHFAPSAPARENLLRQGVHPGRILVTGNTGIDALYLVRERLRLDPACRAQAQAALAQHGLQRFFSAGRQFVLVSAHRRAPVGDSIDAMCSAVGELCARYPGVDVVFPLDSDAPAQCAVGTRLAPLQIDNLVLCPALDYLPFVALLLGAALVLTDSGAVQEEAHSLGTPVVDLRAAGESGEGSAHLAGWHRARIVAAAAGVLDAAALHRSGNTFHGDGHAARRILAAFERYPDDA